MEYLTSDVDFMKVYSKLKKSHKDCHEEYKEAYSESRTAILEMLKNEGCDFNSLNSKNYGGLWRRQSDSDFSDVPIGKVKFGFGSSIMSLEGVDEEDVVVLLKDYKIDVTCQIWHIQRKKQKSQKPTIIKEIVIKTILP